MEYKYNRQAQRTEIKDQNETVHSYEYDKLGRQTQDRITAAGSGIDTAVRRIARTYNSRGLPEKVTSYDNPAVGSGAIVNQVQWEYNDLGLPVTEYQEHGAAVDTSTSPKVQYAYDDAPDAYDEVANGFRPTSITYPNGRKLRFEYSDLDGDKLGRITDLADDENGGIGTHLTQYTRLGLGQIVKVDYTEPDLRFDLAHGSGAALLAGLDRFGRVIDLLWKDYGANTDAVRIKHGYDRAGNRTYREDTVAAANNKDLDEFYTYDRVNQLKTLQRGNLTGTPPTGVVSKNFAERWCLDATGNWSGFDQDDDGDDAWDLEQTRTHNEANEITDITNGGWVDPVHDRAGNMTTIPQPDEPTEGFDLTYDAWNRLVKVEDAGSPVAEYEYDGLMRRTTKKTYTAGQLSETRHFYYSTRWQVLEERVESADSSSSSSSSGGDLGHAERQYVWGLRYIDDLVLRERDTTGNGTLDERLYALQDPNWNVVAVADKNGNIQERYIYTAYGKPTILNSDFTEKPAGTGFDWEYLYTNRRLDPETGVYYCRARCYGAQLGRFLSRDRIGLGAPDPNRYRYVGNSAVNAVDPTGFKEMRENSYFIIENATGLFGEWVESTAEKAGEALRMDEGFENKWAEKHEMRETFRTAEEDDIIVFLGHLYYRTKSKEVGIQPATDWPFVDLTSWARTTYSLDEMIADINRRRGAPALIFFSSCRAALLGPQIVKRTRTKVVIGADRKLGLGAGRLLIQKLVEHIDSDKPIAEVLKTINTKGGVRSLGQPVRLRVFGDPAHMRKSFKELLRKGVNTLPRRKGIPRLRGGPDMMPLTPFGPYDESGRAPNSA